MITIGSIWAAITIIQQFTYPLYYFYTREENAELGQTLLRAGVYRFMAFRHHYGAFAFFYVLSLYLNNKKSYYLLFLAFILIAFYYFGTRQFAAGLLVCMVILILMQKGSTRVIALTLIFSFFGTLFYFRDVLFGQFIQLTKDDTTSDSYVRYLSAEFFLFEYWPNWFVTLTGNGVAHLKSGYGREMYGYAFKGLHRVDVGIIGSFNTFGIFYVINLVFINLKGILVHLYDKRNNYLKLNFYNSIILIILTDYFVIPSAIPFFCLVFYLLETSAVSYAKINYTKIRH